MPRPALMALLGVGVDPPAATAMPMPPASRTVASSATIRVRPFPMNLMCVSLPRDPDDRRGWSSSPPRYRIGAGRVEGAVAHHGSAAVEDAGRLKREAEVAGHVLEQPGARREDGRMDDEHVLVD